MNKQMKKTAMTMLFVFLLISASGPAYSFFGMLGGLIGNVLGGSSGGIGGLIGNIFGGLGGGGAASAVSGAAGNALTTSATNVAAGQSSGSALNGLSGVISSTGPVISNVAGGVVNSLGGKTGITNMASGLFGKGGLFNGGMGTLGISGGQNTAAEQATISKQLQGVDPSIRNTMMNFKMPTLSSIDPISKMMGPTLNNLGPKLTGVKNSGGAFLGVQSGTTSNLLVDAANDIGNKTGLKFPTPKGFVQNPLGPAFPPLPKVPGMKWVQPPPPPFFPSFLPMPPVPPILVPAGEEDEEYYAEEPHQQQKEEEGGLLSGLIPGLGFPTQTNPPVTVNPQLPIEQPQIINDPIITEPLLTEEVALEDDNEVDSELTGTDIENGSRSVSVLGGGLNGILQRIKRMRGGWHQIPKNCIRLNPGLCKELKGLIRRLNPETIDEYTVAIEDIKVQFQAIQETDAFKKLLEIKKKPYSLHLFDLLMRKYKKIQALSPKYPLILKEQNTRNLQQ